MPSREFHYAPDTPSVKTSLLSAPRRADVEATRHATKQDEGRQGWYHGSHCGPPSVRARQPDNRRAARQRGEACVGGSRQRRGMRAAPRFNPNEPFGSQFPETEPCGSSIFPASTIADSGSRAVPDSQLSTDVESAVADRAVYEDTTGGLLGTHTTGASCQPDTTGIAPRTGATGAQPQPSTGVKLRRSRRAEGRYRPYPGVIMIREKRAAQFT